MDCPCTVAERSSLGVRRLDLKFFSFDDEVNEQVSALHVAFTCATLLSAVVNQQAARRIAGGILRKLVEAW